MKSRTVFIGDWVNRVGDIMSVVPAGDSAEGVIVSFSPQAVLLRLLFYFVRRRGLHGQVLSEDRINVIAADGELLFWIQGLQDELGMTKVLRVLADPTPLDGWEDVFGPGWLTGKNEFARIGVEKKL